MLYNKKLVLRIITIVIGITILIGTVSYFSLVYAYAATATTTTTTTVTEEEDKRQQAIDQIIISEEQKDLDNDTKTVTLLPPKIGGKQPTIPNTFPVSHYTNSTGNRTIYAIIIVHHSPDDIREMELLGLKYFTIFTSGSDFLRKDIHPLSSILKNNTIPINIGDSLKLDDYRVCIHFSAYENDNICHGYNTVKGEILNTYFLSNELEYVCQDLKEEGITKGYQREKLQEERFFEPKEIEC